MKIKLYLPVLALAAALPASANEPWNDPEVNGINRLNTRADFFSFENEELAKCRDYTKSSRFMTIDGDWKFHWVPNANERPANFHTLSFDDSKWVSMPVPGNWELNGYGDAIYVNNGYAWRNDWAKNPPFVQDLNNAVGSYRRSFLIPANWAGDRIYLHIGSATSNVTVYVNGKFAGYSEDSKIAAEFDITDFVTPGKDNLIAMQVMRWCDGSYLEDQDFWRFSGIARESYLYSRPQVHIDDIFITPDLVDNYRNGKLNVKLSSATADGHTAELVLTDAVGKQVKRASGIFANGNLNVDFAVSNPQKWSAETPYLYTLTIKLLDKSGKAIEIIPQRVGFRKVEIKDGQFLVNGKAVLIKGVNRHELSPTGGYVVSLEEMLADLKVMRELNINAVRTCHYPDDPRWYDLCDEYGFYITAEANNESHGMGYGKETLGANPAYHYATTERMQHNVDLLKNHPSVVVWSLGNESGFGKNFEDAYDWAKSYDSSRPVQYERAGLERATDIYCPMYLDVARTEKYAAQDPGRPIIQCEYNHVMGNSGGGFKDYWDVFRKYPKAQGGYIWDFADQGLRDKSKVTGKTIYTYGGDYGRFPASDNNFNCNGIVSPDRAFNPHAWEVKYCHQNIWTKIADSAKGEIEIYNENFFKTLNDITLHYSILADGLEVAHGSMPLKGTNIAPQATKKLKIKEMAKALKELKSEGKEILCNIYYTTAEDALTGKDAEVARQQFVMSPYTFPTIEKPAANGTVAAEDHAAYLKVTAGDVVYYFDKSSGFITYIDANGKSLLAEEGCIRPDFWRAPTDNDYGADLHKKLGAWNNPQMELKSFDTEDTASGKSVKCSYVLPALNAKLNMNYIIAPDGKLIVSQALKVDKERADKPMLPRFGLQMILTPGFENIDYYGKGPHENYSDRNSHTFIGRYKQTVDEQFYPYIRPQDTGNKTEVRRWSVADNGGHSLTFEGIRPMECQALHYSKTDLYSGPVKHHTQRHSGDLTPSANTYLVVADRMMGVGGIDSWGSWPLEAYRIPYDDQNFTVIITVK